MIRLQARLGLVAVVACASVITGCGGSSDTEKVEATVKSYLSALAEGDGETACEALSGEGKRELVAMANSRVPELGTIDCPSVVEQLSGAMGADETSVLKDVEVTDVQVEGDTATATIAGATVSPTLVRYEDGWLIDRGFFDG